MHAPCMRPQCTMYQGTSIIKNSSDPAVGICLGFYGGPKGGVVFHERGTPVCDPSADTGEEAVSEQGPSERSGALYTVCTKTSRSSLSVASTRTASRRIAASASTKQQPGKGDLMPARGRLVERRCGHILVHESIVHTKAPLPQDHTALGIPTPNVGS